MPSHPRRGLSRLRPRPLNDEGTSLIEMLVALSIFGILSTALLGLLLSTVQTSRVSKGRAVASQLASSYVDETRAEGAIAVAPGRTEFVRNVGGLDYTITRDAQFVARGQASTSCSSPGNPSYLRVRVQVTWPNMGSAKPVESNTVVTPSVGDVDDTKGNIAISVIDRDGAPLAGVPVTLTPGTSVGPGTVQTTTAEGCAYFAFVNPGTYTASLLKTGFTDVQRRANPFASTSVSASQTATVSMQFDESAAINLSPDTDSAHPAPADLAYTLSSTTFSNASQTLLVPGGTLPTAVNNLFPVAAGYQGWAGGCLSNDPGEFNRVDPAPSNRGGSAELVLPLSKFEMSPTRLGLPPVGSWTVTATQTASDAGCPSGQSYSWSGSGGTIGGALPFGEWTFTVTDSLGSRTTTPVTFTSADTGITSMAVAL